VILACAPHLLPGVPSVLSHSRSSTLCCCSVVPPEARRESDRQTDREGEREVAWSPHRDTSAAQRRTLTPSFPSGPTSRGSCCRQRNNSGGIITFSSVDHTHYHSPHPPTPASRGLLAAVFHTFRRPPPLSLNRARLKRQKAPDHTRKHNSSHVRPSSASRDASWRQASRDRKEKSTISPTTAAYKSANARLVSSLTARPESCLLFCCAVRQSPVHQSTHHPSPPQPDLKNGLTEAPRTS